MFLGYSLTEIIYSQRYRRWEIHNLLLDETLVAVMNGSSRYPFGTHRWKFINNVCNDDEKDYRSLNLHSLTEETGKFCCEDGLCIDSGLVCDDVENCADGEDEEKCNMVHFMDREKYRHDKPPVEVVSSNQTAVLVPLRINCSLTVVDLGKDKIYHPFSEGFI